MRILSIGPMDGLSNTCLHRHWALTKYAGLIDVVNTSGVKSSFKGGKTKRVNMWSV